MRRCRGVIFSYFFEVLRVRDQSQSLLQALKLNFLSKMCDLVAYLASYFTFRRFCQVHCPGTTKRRIQEAVIKSAASAASLGFAGERQQRPGMRTTGDGTLPCKSQGGCASSRLDHGFLNSSFGSAGTVNPAKTAKSAIIRQRRIQITNF